MDVEDDGRFRMHLDLDWGDVLRRLAVRQVAGTASEGTEEWRQMSLQADKEAKYAEPW